MRLLCLLSSHMETVWSFSHLLCQTQVWSTFRELVREPTSSSASFSLLGLKQETGSERHKLSFRIRIQRSARERSCWTHWPLQPYNHRPHIQSHLIHRGLAVGRRSRAVQAVTPHPGFSALLLLLSSRSYLYGWRESPGATELAVNDMLSYCSDTLTDWKFS